MMESLNLLVAIASLLVAIGTRRFGRYKKNAVLE
jgi:hypothetical protein